MTQDTNARVSSFLRKGWDESGATTHEDEQVAGQGIGLGIARAYAAAGAALVITGRDQAKLERAAAELAALVRSAHEDEEHA